MTKNTRFSPEVRQRAIRMVLESQGEYDSQWAAICSIAPKIGCTPETLRVWVRQHERDTGGGDGGLTTAERQRLKELERENRELRRSNDILRQASAYFAKAEFDRWKGWAILLRQKQKKLIMLPSETMIWQPEFTDKTLSRKPGAVHTT